jgi:hypothetical protein
MRLVRFWVEDETGAPVAAVSSGSRCSLVVEYSSSNDVPRRDLFMSFMIFTLTGAPVTLVNTNLLDQDFAVSPSEGIIRFRIPKLALTAGRYVLDLHLATHSGYHTMDHIKSGAAFDVTDGDFYNTGRAGSRHAPLLIEGGWEIKEAVGAKP